MIAKKDPVDTDQVYEFARSELSGYRGKPHISPKDVANLFGITPPTAHHHLRKLVDNRQLVSTKRGQYQLPAAQAWEVEALGYFASATTPTEVRKKQRERAQGLTDGRLAGLW